MKNFKIAFCLFSILVLYTNCSKDCKLKPVSKEEPQITAFAAANNYDVVKHTSGIYYQILDAGSGVKPTVNSRISITYKGTFLDGQTFDEQTTPNNTVDKPAWALSGLIEGWKIGIPLIGEGGRIRLIVPSSLAYGCEDYYGIPGNSVLFFDVTLVQVF